MELPQILITGKFQPNDLLVSVSESTRKIDPAIESQIEPIWEEKIKRAKENGQNCYNGNSYRLNSIQKQDNKLMLDFGIIEYKIRDGLIAIPEYFNLPEEYWRKGCYSSASIKTSDERYLMAELSGKSMNRNKVDLIGGIMETNFGMSLGDDIFQSLYAELNEEAGIEKNDIRESYLQTVYVAKETNVGLYFEVILSVSSDELLERFKQNKDTDIKSLRVYTRNEYIHELENHASSSKNLTAKILSI